MRGIAALLAGAVSGSCTNFYRKSADKETFGILEHKGAYVFDMEKDFSIATPAPASLSNLPGQSDESIFLGEFAAAEIGAKILSLADALGLAVVHNREYQNRKDILFLAALRLTLIRHDFQPMFFGTGSLDIHENSRAIAGDIDNLVRESTFTRRADFGFDLLLKTGARLSAVVTADFLKFINGNLDTINDSRFAAVVSQPLLRGAGVLATTENLTQAERDVFYAIRNFARFRQDFSVRIASDYYRILQTRDSARNNFSAYQGFTLSVAREEALAAEDRRTVSALGRLRQAQLRSELRWINSLRNYQALLDRFKIDLGIPVDSNIVLDDRELARLQIIDPTISRDEAAKIAVATRLDLQNVRDINEDTARHILVAAQDLLPGLDIIGTVDNSSLPSRRVLGLDSRLTNWSASLDLDLPLDHKEERNAYRASLIAHQATQRELGLAEDEVRLEIYDAWRNLDQARRQYEISELGVEIALARVEEQQLLMELGRGTAKDLVDAQDDLTDSQNDLTAATVNHTISRLNFWRDMGILFINKDGGWERKLNEEGR